MINFDFESYNHLKLEKTNLDNILSKFISDNNMNGWYNLDPKDLDEIISTATYIKDNCDKFIVIGIGGSYLGSRAIIEALSPYFKKNNPEIIYVGNDLSTDYLNELLDYIKDSEVIINVISKSGTTLEPSIAFDTLLEFMNRKYGKLSLSRRIIVTTDDTKGELLSRANQYGFKKFVIPQNIGGRYSVLTPVGLLPIAVANIDIKKLYSGAMLAKENLKECYKYTVLRDMMYRNNKIVESFTIYEPKLYYFTEWLKQLFGESQGKDGKGLLPISTVNTRDLHSMGQYYQDGPAILFETVLLTKPQTQIDLYRYNKTMSEVNDIAAYSVAQSHYDGHVDSTIISMDSLNELNIGYLIFFFQMSAMLGSYLLGVNYYDQPGVSNYKEIMNKKIEDNH